MPISRGRSCSIQKKLGEEYLSIMCAAYPRVMNVVDDVLQRSLDLSCPEAARLVLLDPTRWSSTKRMERGATPAWDDCPFSARPTRTPTNRTNIFERSGVLSSGFCRIATAPCGNVWPFSARSAISSMQTAATGRIPQTPEVLDAYRDGVERGLFDEALQLACAPNPPKQLELVLELIVDRIGSDFTLRAFSTAIGSSWRRSIGPLIRAWTTSDGATPRRTRNSYAPLMSRHEHILEHYLVSYVYRTLFPLGPQESPTSIQDQCLMLLAYYAIVQTLLIGVAAFHGTKFDVDHVIQVIQASTKTFEHSLAFPPRALQILAKNGMTSCAGLAILLLISGACQRARCGTATVRSASGLMPEVPHAGEHHREAQLVRRGDYVVIAHRTARLNHRGDAVLGGFLDAIGKGKKGVGSEHRSLQEAARPSWRRPSPNQRGSSALLPR